MSKKILFLTLQTFGAPGGIQKMNRTLAYSLSQLCKKNDWHVNVYASHDQQSDLMSQYLQASVFKGFNKYKFLFIWKSIMNGMNADLVILSHINLSVAGIIIRLFNPKCKIWLVTHGVEVWRPLKLWKKAIWKIADQIICVSSFTKNKVIALHHASPDRCLILNNALDPFIQLPASFNKPEYLLERYHLNTEHKIVFTLTRMASTEMFKGYEKVIEAVSRIKQNIPDIKYILAGPCDAFEKARIGQLITDYGLKDNFILTGYIEETELADHFLMADLFVLPSKKEGFGIVFVEAMALGLPVICGNADGSTDAVRNGEMGTAIDPDDNQLLEQTMTRKLNHVLTIDERRNIQRLCLKYFNEQDYRNTLEKLIKDGTAA